MKHILLFFLLSGSLSAFSQVPDSANLRQFDASKWGQQVTGRSQGPILQSGTIEWRQPNTPDTLRATLIVYYDSGPAILHTKPGFVVRGEIFLDDRKKVIKAPWEVLTYKLKGAINVK